MPTARTELAQLRSVVGQSPLGQLIQLGTKVIDTARTLNALLDGPPLPAGEHDDLPFLDAMAMLTDAKNAFEARYQHADPELRETFKVWDDATGTDGLLDDLEEKIAGRWVNCPEILARWNGERDEQAVKLSERIGELTPEQAQAMDERLASGNPALHAKLAALVQDAIGDTEPETTPVVPEPVSVVEPPAPEPEPVVLSTPVHTPPPASPATEQRQMCFAVDKLLYGKARRRHIAQGRGW
jgi:hypothetical protein